MLHKAMIGEAKADPDIKTFGDTKAWQEWCKDTRSKTGYKQAINPSRINPYPFFFN